MKINAKALAVISLLSFLLMITMNFLAVFLPLNGIETGEVSDRYYNYFTPAGFTFSIWSVIYTLLFLFTISQLVYISRRDERARPDVLPYFILSCLANSAWLVAWHFEQLWIGVIIMILLLLSLVMIHRRLNLPYSWKPAGKKWMTDIPFSIYLGWISVALIANIAAALVKSGINMNLPEESWAAIMVGIATILALILGYGKRNTWYAITIAWGLFGILKARQAEDQTQLLEKVLSACLGLVLLVVVERFIYGLRKDREP